MFGLLWEYDSNLTGTSSAHDPCPNLTSVPTVPCTWMANVIDGKKSPDKKDFSRRIGFAYDPFGSGTFAPGSPTLATPFNGQNQTVESA